MARKFLYIFAALIVLVLGAALVYRVWGDRLMVMAMVPSTEYHALVPRNAADYADPKLWYAMGKSPPLPLPQGAASAPAGQRQAAVFFVHPTSYIDRSAWNAPVGNKRSDDLAETFIHRQANVFSGLGPLWAPRYRQAAFGAFLTDKPEANEALDAAYGDVAAAFDAFLKANPDGPLILAAHSQGSRHLMRLLAQKVAGTPLAWRIVAAYVIGWPISVSADLPALGLPACRAPGETRCILSWQSFAEPADTGYVLRPYDASEGLARRTRKGTPMLCTNPLTGGTGGAAPPNANRGMAGHDEKADNQVLFVHGVGAHCDRQGFLRISDAPDLGPYVLPGNNYHVYDYALYWGECPR